MNPLNLSAIGNLPYLAHPELFVSASSAFSSRHTGKSKGVAKSAKIARPADAYYSPQSSEPDNENVDSEGDGDTSFANTSPDSGGGAESSGGSLRSQKRPIPHEQKDNKYFERRRRNNLAAKKSRDARKTREDHLAMRVAHLEKENAIFRAQVAILREEMSVLRVYICQKANGSLSPEEVA